MIKAIVTDIEGTTTSISFVADVLFPYARARMADFIIEHQGEPEVARQIEAVRSEINNADASVQEVIDTLIAWIDQDLKITPLKSLQGMIWQSGYDSGELTGHLYPEVAACLAHWKNQGIHLSVYSSGSEVAQKLLFGNSVAGDLTPLFENFFDTRVGGKREPDSYRRIQQQLNYAADEILFLSDIVEELDAAAAAGINTLALNRDHKSLDLGEHTQISGFDEITL